MIREFLFKCIQLATFLLVVNSVYSQADFEGVITYKFTYDTHVAGITKETLQVQFGEEAMTSFKGGNYKEISNAVFMSYQLYRHGDTSIYHLNNYTDDTLFVMRADKEPETKLDYEIVENAETILGYPCNLLKVKTENGTKSYYYSSDLALNPDNYAAYTYSNKSKIVRIMKSVYLKLVLEYPAFTVTAQAINIEQKNIPDSEFQVPTGKIHKEVPF